MSRSALDSFRRNHPDPRDFLIWSHATLAIGFTLLASTGIAFADDPPLVLSNEQIGMTRAEIDATQPDRNHETPSAATDRSAPNPNAATAPAWGSEFVSNEGSLPAGCADSALGTPGAAIGSFDQCIEVSIRGGVGYEESARVCHALFPGQG